MEHKKLIPNSTQIPNVLIDRLFPFLSESELRALLYIARRTYGFQKEKDSIGLGQFVDGIKKLDGTILDHGAGLTRTTAMRTLKVLSEVGLIDVKRTKPGQKGRKENVYSINLEMNIDALIHKLETVRVDVKGKRARNATLFDLVPSTTRVAPDTSVGSDTRVVSPIDPSTRVAPDTHKTKGNKDTKQSIYAPGAHRRLIQFFHDTTLKSRGFKPTIGPEDGAQLKRVLQLEAIPEDDLEKFMLYFLVHPSFKTFSPTLTTMLSSGVLNGLRNRILNDPKFYKELDTMADRYYPRRGGPLPPQEPGKPRPPQTEGESEYTPANLRPLGDLMSDLIKRMGLVPTTSG